jgi:hypothetical protein
MDRANAGQGGITISALREKVKDLYGDRLIGSDAMSATVREMYQSLIGSTDFASFISRMPAFDTEVLRGFQADQARLISDSFAARIPMSLMSDLAEQARQLQGITAPDLPMWEAMNRQILADPILLRPMPHFALMEDMRGAIAGMLDVQQAGLRLLDMPPGVGIIADIVARWHDMYADVIGRNNSLVSTMTSDLWAMSAARIAPDLHGLSKNTALMARAYDEYSLAHIATLTDQMKHAGLDTLLSSPTFLRDDMMLPTFSTSLAVRSSRRVVEYHDGGPESTETTTIETWQETAYEFEAKLSYSPQLQKRWQGAWDTLHSNSRDRIPQTAHSARELVNQGLAEMAPDEVFTAEDISKFGANGKVTRRMRVRYALGGHGSKQIEWVENTAKTLDSLYDVFSGQAHNRGDQDEFTSAQMESILLATAGLMGFVLSKHQRRSSQ